MTKLGNLDEKHGKFDQKKKILPWSIWKMTANVVFVTKTGEHIKICAKNNTYKSKFLYK